MKCEQRCSILCLRECVESQCVIGVSIHSDGASSSLGLPTQTCLEHEAQETYSSVVLNLGAVCYYSMIYHILTISAFIIPVIS